jgi:CDP-diacylglycerol---serine O-phosphatidyltransferase
MGLDQTNDHSLFRGLPTPGAAGTVASLVILHQYLLVKFAEDVPLGYVQGAALGIPLVMLLCGFGMVSSVPYVHVTNRYVRGPRAFPYVVRVVVLLAIAVWWIQLSLALAFTVYALSGPIRLYWSRYHHHRHSPSGILESPARDADSTLTRAK